MTFKRPPVPTRRSNVLAETARLRRQAQIDEHLGRAAPAAPTAAPAVRLPHDLALLVDLAAHGDRTARAGLEALDPRSPDAALLVELAYQGDPTVLRAFDGLTRKRRGSDGRVISKLGHTSIVVSNHRRGYMPRRDRAATAMVLDKLRSETALGRRQTRELA